MAAAAAPASAAPVAALLSADRRGEGCRNNDAERGGVTEVMVTKTTTAMTTTSNDKRVCPAAIWLGLLSLEDSGRQFVLQ